MVSEGPSIQPTIPWLPGGRTVDLGNSRSIFVRDSGEDSGGATLVLLHGWMATVDLNFGFAYRSLAEEFRVVAFDQRGHGRGLRDRHGFSFARAAGDVEAVLDALAIERAIFVGYSMGGPVALTIARSAPERVDGLVLCATAGTFSRSPLWRLGFSAAHPIVGWSRMIPDSRLRRQLRRRFIARRAAGAYRDWIAREIAPSDLTSVAQAGIELGRFDALGWLPTLQATAAAVVTANDELVPPRSQHVLAESLDATVFEVSGGHTVCFDAPDVFTPVLVEAARSVARATR